MPYIKSLFGPLQPLFLNLVYTVVEPHFKTQHQIEFEVGAHLMSNTGVLSASALWWETVYEGQKSTNCDAWNWFN